QWDTRLWKLISLLGQLRQPCVAAFAARKRSAGPPGAAVSRGLRGDEARLHQTRRCGLVLLAPPHGGRAERTLRVLLPLRVRDQPAGGRQDSDAAKQRQDSDPRGDGCEQTGRYPSGATALRYVLGQ